MAVVLYTGGTGTQTSDNHTAETPDAIQDVLESLTAKDRKNRYIGLAN